MIHLKEHFINLLTNEGDGKVRLHNRIFKQLSSNIKNKNDSTNIQQVAFAYSYLTAISFLYKYTHFVDIDNELYIQNSDIKELLGYNRVTKTIDKVIKKGGILDSIGLTATTKDYPIRYKISTDEKINGISIREFVTVSELEVNDINYEAIKRIVKNRNYEIKEPIFLTTRFEDSEYGTLYNVANTHDITLNEFLTFVTAPDLNNIDFLLYGYFKSKCKGYPENMKAMAMYKICLELGMANTAFISHLEVLKKKKYINVYHNNWKAKEDTYIKMDANKYFWKGIKENAI